MRKGLLLIFSVLLLSGCSDKTTAVYTQIKDVKKLVVSEMTIGKIGKLPGDWTDVFKIGDRVAIYSYNTYMRAYIDLSELTPEDITITKDHCTLVLPPVRTEFTGRDWSMTEEHYRVTGLRFQVNPAERQQLKDIMFEHLRDEVESDGQFRAKLIREGQEKARSYFGILLSTWGYTSDITFKKPTV